MTPRTTRVKMDTHCGRVRSLVLAAVRQDIATEVPSRSAVALHFVLLAMARQLALACEEPQEVTTRGLVRTTLVRGVTTTRAAQ